jgi:hypothetical protein
METPRFIDHGAKRILFLDFARASPRQHADGMRAAAAILAREPPRSVLVLVDVTGLSENAGTEEEVRRFLAEAGPHIRAKAVVGLVGLKRILARRVQEHAAWDHHDFEDLEAARNWLASRA